MRNYNLFCRPDRAELVCAVPEDRPVPAFIKGPPWKFIGRVKERTIGSLSFNHEAAEASVHFNGFYLFQVINASDLRRKVDRACAEAIDLTPTGDTYHQSKASTHHEGNWSIPCEVKLTIEVGIPADAV